MASRSRLARASCSTRERVGLCKAEEGGREQPTGRELARIAFDCHKVAVLEREEEGGPGSCLRLLPLGR
eukprot:12410034-Alexandrium_andersonii.AAC.1